MAEGEVPEATASVKSWPVALKVRGCGLPFALSVNDKLPEAAPPAVGVKVIATPQVPDGTTGFVVEQVVPEATMAKGPVTAIGAAKVRLALPVFVTVTVCAGLVVPTGSDGKVGGADRLTTGSAAEFTVSVKVLVTEITPVPLAVMVIVWLLTSAAVLAACKVMLPELAVPGWVIVAVTPLGKVLVASVTLPV